MTNVTEEIEEQEQYRKSHEPPTDQTVLSDGDLLDKLADRIAHGRNNAIDLENITEDIQFFIGDDDVFTARTDDYLRTVRLALRRAIARI